MKINAPIIEYYYRNVYIRVVKQKQKTMTDKIKLHDGLPPMTKDQWIDYAHNLYTTLLIDETNSKGSWHYNESVKFYKKICKVCGIKTI